MSSIEKDIAISVITPCYNHGAYVTAAVDCIKNYDWKIPVEHIIVDDGSTDLETLNVLKELKGENLTIISQPNGGPSKARNTGINKAQGKYILPLDADNIIFPAVFEKAYAIMEQDISISVVYTDAQYFGDRNDLWKVGKLNIHRLFLYNQIDTCALLRKDDLVKLGAYDEDRDIMSNEDWELWLRMISNNKKLFYLEEIGFKYYVANNSLSVTISQKKTQSLLNYLIKKYPSLYAAYYQQLYDEKCRLDFAKSYLKKNRLKSIIKILLNKEIV